MLRVDGRMRRIDTALPLTTESIERLVVDIMPDANREQFDRRHDTDFSYEIDGLARFRANVFRDRHGMGAVFRAIPADILTAEQLGLSPQILQLCQLTKGLVVVSGPTGSGKSTIPPGRSRRPPSGSRSRETRRRAWRSGSRGPGCRRAGRPQPARRVAG